MSDHDYDGPDRRTTVRREADKPFEKRVRFDPTINLGHMLTMFGVIVGIMGSWALMDKRLTVLEEFRIAQRERDLSQDESSKEKYQEVRTVLDDIKRSVEKVSDRVGVPR